MFKSNGKSEKRRERACSLAPEKQTLLLEEQLYPLAQEDSKELVQELEEQQDPEPRTPLRPTVTSITSVTYNSSKYSASKTVSCLNQQPEETWLSSDVPSLFTNHRGSRDHPAEIYLWITMTWMSENLNLTLTLPSSPTNHSKIRNNSCLPTTFRQETAFTGISSIYICRFSVEH